MINVRIIDALLYMEKNPIDSAVKGSNPGRVKRFFSPSKPFQTGSGAHPASYSLCTGFFFLGSKAVRA
jgi:hypothetical protein